jgi:hypothetical protein
MEYTVVKQRVIVWLLASLVATPALATDLKVRNVRLVDAGHTTSIVGTVVNTSDHTVQGGYLDMEVTKRNDLEPGQAYRIWQPVQYDGAPATAKVQARDPQVAVSASVVPYPGTVVAQ